ncbi:NAD(P)H-hydrate dehydratase [Pseudoruegeria sp. HB172150]|uniref:NAD(P)H-hydrate dehydratase n=1 Tax=Pseudoruegeria sp. HB172150 TaxID=2721164 RepID=UPI001551E4CF
MTELLTAAQMQAVIDAAIASGEVTGLELMERAGRGVVEAVFEEWPELQATTHRAVVLCGPGNNGGTGFVVARLLKHWGWEVEVFLYGNPSQLPPEARANYERWGEMGEVTALQPDKVAATCNLEDPAIYIDALSGTGLGRSVEDVISKTAFAVHGELGRAGVAIDCPSGLCLDSGRHFAESTVFDVALTVSIHHEKVGHRLFPGAGFCGALQVVDIGVGSYGDGSSSVELLTKDAVLFELEDSPHASKSAFQHKYAHGHALILSGGPGRGGAARMAARGALRIGAGLVTIGCPPAAMQENAAQLNAVMLRGVGDVSALEKTLEDTRLNALCLGPGLGLTDDSKALIETCLKARRKTVLDADALTLIAGDPALFALLHDNCILTPHGGEFARLFLDIANKLAEEAASAPAYSKVDATRDAAASAGCTILFKGPDTVIAEPSGRASINSAAYDRAAPWLATAGAGDVLAGFIAGLLARGFAPMQAAETAAWLHVECARAFGPGLIAEDLPEMLPKVFRDLGL